MEDLMTYNIDLFVQLKKAGITQRKFSVMLGIDETVVSRVINGRWLLTKEEKQHWAEILSCKMEDIF